MLLATDVKYLQSVGRKGDNNLEFDGPMGLGIFYIIEQKLH